MDTRDGEIFDFNKREDMERLFKKAIKQQKSPLEFMMEMKQEPTERQLTRKPPRVGRNELCPCGSGKKFKKCCLNLEKGDL